MYIGDYLGRRQIYSPDKLAIIDAGKPGEPGYTYAQLNERANRLANFLKDEVGVGKGDRVGIFARDGIEHLDLFFALSKLGAIHVAFNWRLHPQELARLCEDTTPKAIVYSDDFRLTIANLQAGPASASITHYLHIEGPGVADSLLFAEARDGSPAEPVTCETLEAEDIAALLFTGGTTGLAKGAQISHRQIAWNTLNTVIHDVTHNDVYLNVFPMFHTGGLFVYTLPQVIFGGTTILTHQFDPAQVLDLIRALQSHGLRRRADHVPDDDPGAELGDRGPDQPAFLHIRRRAAAGTAGREVHRREGHPVQAGVRHDRVRAGHLRARAGGCHSQGRLHRPAELLRGCPHRG